MTALPERSGHAAVDEGVELLERALGYTRGILATVTTADLCQPTPCDLWRLADLLAHMEDSLDAFAEGASGAIGLRSAAPAPVPDRVATLQAKACALLGAWASADSATVDVGGQPVPVATVSRLAAIEIAVHGWDVGQATGRGAPIPEPLAAALLPVAEALAASSEQTGRFARPVPVPPGASAATRLLAALGRQSTPP